MRIISRATLRQFWENNLYRDAEQPLKAWYDEARKANWTSSSDIKRLYRHASFVGKNRVIFNIHGNKYRLIVSINYQYSIIYIKFIGTHAQYDHVDVGNI